MPSLFDRRLLEDDYRPKVVAYYFKRWDGFTMPFHAHRAVEIMYVIDGRCTVETKEEAFPLEKGEFIVLAAGLEHRLIVEEGAPCRMLNAEFIFTLQREELNGYPSLKRLAAEDAELRAFLRTEASYLLLTDPADAYATLKSLVLELDRDSGKDSLMAQLLLAQLFIRIGRLSAEAAVRLQPEAGLHVSRSLAYIHHHYDCDIQVKDIAAAVNLHPGYLHRIFKAATGRTVMDYLASLRMEKARMLLEQTDIPVIDISAYVGINSSQYFSTLFKKHTGCTPIAFRRSVGKTNHGFES